MNKIDVIIEKLEELYPVAECSLDYENPLQLLISTQLSAQCTDARVNMVTPALFARFPDVKSFAEADVTEVEELIKSTGFYRNKAKNIVACCQRILSEYGGEVPDTMEDLLSLAGVGRKTANLVLGDAFGKPSVVVDTHCIRLTNRLGLTKNKDPEKIEKDLWRILPPEKSSAFCHRLVLHGRAVCPARKPKCDQCVLGDVCPSKGRV
ncbi:MAG: endonuclease III [Ruminococcaceae bacterium]|nr:endonuclease III [Oscillospiraceae bacterium]